MKTHEFKSSNTVKASNLILLAIMILFCKILLDTDVPFNKTKASEELISIKYLIPNNQLLISTTATRNLENEKLIRRIKTAEDELKQEKDKIKNHDSPKNFSITKISDCLIAEKEPVLDVERAMTIIFPESAKNNFTADTKLNSTIFLMELKKQASEKTKQAVENYAFEMKLKEYLTFEAEKPLKLEAWMINEKCWCPELRETVAFAEKNKNP